MQVAAVPHLRDTLEVRQWTNMWIRSCRTLLGGHNHDRSDQSNK